MTQRIDSPPSYTPGCAGIGNSQRRIYASSACNVYVLFVLVVAWYMAPSVVPETTKLIKNSAQARQVPTLEQGSAAARADEMTGRPILHFDVATVQGEKQLVLKATAPDGHQMGTFPAVGAVWSPKGDVFAYLSGGDKGSCQTLDWADVDRRHGTLYDFWAGGGGPCVGWHPAWSPDGKRIATITLGRSGGYWVEVIDVVEGKLRSRHKLPDGILNYPNYFSPPDKLRWSPDGRKILVSWESAAVLDLESGEVQRISQKNAMAEWAPDSESIYYIEILNPHGPGERALGDFYLRRLGSRERTKLMDAAGLRGLGLKMSTGLNYGGLILSPTGSRLAVVGGSTKGATGSLYVYDLKPGQIIALDSPAKAFRTEDVLPQVEWSPDERRLAVIAVGWPDRSLKPSRTLVKYVSVKILDVTTGAWSTLVTIDFPTEGDVETLDVLGFKALSWTQ